MDVEINTIRDYILNPSTFGALMTGIVLGWIGHALLKRPLRKLITEDRNRLQKEREDLRQELKDLRQKHEQAMEKYGQAKTDDQAHIENLISRLRTVHCALCGGGMRKVRPDENIKYPRNSDEVDMICLSDDCKHRASFNLEVIQNMMLDMVRAQ